MINIVDENDEHNDHDAQGDHQNDHDNDDQEVHFARDNLHGKCE